MREMQGRPLCKTFFLCRKIIIFNKRLLISNYKNSISKSVGKGEPFFLVKSKNRYVEKAKLSIQFL